tara:strand:- start:12456 stop:12626 length:171 start_codon:yes stop_codon:yes gene_type:complete
MNQEKEKKSSNRGKKQYTGVVIRDFGFKGTQYKAGDNFKTKEKKYYDNLITIKRIK